MPALLLPNSDLVACAWLASLAGLSAGMVGTTLPKSNATLAASGFVQATVFGGSPLAEVPQNHPVVSIDCWASNVSSSKPPWGRANQLAEIVKAATYSPGAILTLPAGYHKARILHALALSEPRRVLGDVASVARFTFDVSFNWVVST
jgi:hypothetical protein